MVDFAQFSHLTFDCYGTLIDWETGILSAIRPVLEKHKVESEDATILRLYVDLESSIESGPYLPYVDVLRSVMAGMAKELGFTPDENDLAVLSQSVGQWPPFSDTVAALKRLKNRYQVVVLSNIDDALFAESQKLLEVPFDEVITAQQIGSYKPNRRNFTFALERLGQPVERVLHVAQSLHHDHEPAKELGFSTVWINRASRLSGTGLAPPSNAKPNLEFADLKSLADATGL
jgi:2-haloacid dehalogenase